MEITIYQRFVKDDSNAIIGKSPITLKMSNSTFDDYIKKEFKAVEKFKNKYLTSFGDERISAKTEYHAARLNFAKGYGFVKVNPRSDIYVLSNNQDKDVA
jgi:hypothetical protein